MQSPNQMNQMNQMGQTDQMGQMGQTDQTDQTGQMDSMPDMAGADQMTGMTGMTDQTAMPVPGQRQAVPIVGVLAGVAVVAVIALIIVVVYFVAVRKCAVASGLDCTAFTGEHISCAANSSDTACICTYTGTGTDCSGCAPAAFNFDDPATYVSCDSTGCTGTLGPQGTSSTWGTGKTCTVLGTASDAVTTTLSGDTLSAAVSSMSGTAASPTWTNFAKFCSPPCAGMSITPYSGDQYKFTPCGKPASGPAYATDSTTPGYASNAFLYLPNSLAPTSLSQNNQTNQNRQMQVAPSKLPGWSA